MNARRIEKNNLAIRPGHDSPDDASCGLRLIRNDGNFLADEMIEQCGFSGIWSSDNRNDSGFHYATTSCASGPEALAGDGARAGGRLRAPRPQLPRVRFFLPEGVPVRRVR